jgi:hypothetical protein
LAQDPEEQGGDAKLRVAEERGAREIEGKKNHVPEKVL